MKAIRRSIVHMHMIIIQQNICARVCTGIKKEKRTDNKVAESETINEVHQ